MEGTSSNLDVFAATLIEAAKADRSILVVTSDSRGSGRLAPFAAAVPEQIVEVGIAEQNLVGISAGLTAAGKKVFAVSPACFLTARALEQIKNDVCYSDRPVKVVGIRYRNRTHAQRRVQAPSAKAMPPTSSTSVARSGAVS